MTYESELVERCADAVMAHLVAFGPRRWSEIRREVFEKHRAEFDPLFKGRFVDSLIERMVQEKLVRDGRADHIELWYVTPQGALSV